MFWWKWTSFFGENRVVAILALSLVGALLLSAVVAFRLRNVGCYTALAFLLCGGGCLACGVMGVSGQSFVAFFALLAGVGGGLYALLFLSLGICRRRRERKTLRAELKRRVEYTLPKEGNTYLRTRLHTALRETDDEAQEVEISLGYARKMLAQVRAAALTPVERLDVEEMARLLSLYGCQTKWTGADMRAVNEIFARLLKLSAKYEVAV